jgi:hypothetical protein
VVKYGNPYCCMVAAWGNAPGRCGQPHTVCSPPHKLTINSIHEGIKIKKLTCEVMVCYVVTSLSCERLSETRVLTCGGRLDGHDPPWSVGPARLSAWRTMRSMTSSWDTTATHPEGPGRPTAGCSAN